MKLCLPIYPMFCPYPLTKNEKRLFVLLVVFGQKIFLSQYPSIQRLNNNNTVVILLKSIK